MRQKVGIEWEDTSETNVEGDEIAEVSILPVLP